MAFATAGVAVYENRGAIEGAISTIGSWFGSGTSEDAENKHLAEMGFHKAPELEPRVWQQVIRLLPGMHEGRGNRFWQRSDWGMNNFLILTGKWSQAEWAKSALAYITYNEGLGDEFFIITGKIEDNGSVSLTGMYVDAKDLPAYPPTTGTLAGTSPDGQPYGPVQYPARGLEWDVVRANPLEVVALAANAYTWADLLDLSTWDRFRRYGGTPGADVGSYSWAWACTEFAARNNLKGVSWLKDASGVWRESPRG